MERLALTPAGIRPLGNRAGQGLVVVVPSGDGEFHAGCDQCEWTSFGTYVNPRAVQIRGLHANHTLKDHLD